MFTLRTGSFRDIEQTFATDFMTARSADPLTPLLVVVPSGAIRTRLQQQLLGRDDFGASILNATFLDMYGLANRLLTEGPLHKEQVIRESAVYSELIRDLLEGHGEFPLQLRSELHTPGKPLLEGLPRALAGTLRDLRDSGARVVDSLKAALEGLLGEEIETAAPTLEIYARVYETLQSRGLRTPADLLRWAKDYVPHSEFLKKQTAVFFYGFYDVTGVQLDLLNALLNHPHATLYFPYIETPAYAFAERLLKDPALTNKHHASGHRGVGASEIDSLDASPALRGSGSPTLEVWSCSGARDEVWAAAKEILRRTDKGLPYDHILVTARSLAPYVDAVEEIFSAHHIPFSMDVERPVGAFPLIKTARLLLTLDRDEAPASTVLDLLRSPYFQPRQPDSGLAERLVRESGIVGGWDSWRERLVVWTKRPTPADFPQAQTVARELLSIVESVQHDLTRESNQELSWSRQIAWARMVLERRLALPKDASFRERMLWKELLEGMDSLNALEALGRPASRERFLRVWEEKLDDWSVSFSRGPRAGVQVIDVMGARGLSFEAVFLMGMNEKSFPRLIREDPFLSDAARSTLARTLGARLARKMDGYQEERLLAELVRSSAESSLYISFQRSDEEGKALVPSLYLQNMKPDVSRIIPRAPIEKWRQSPIESLTPKELSVLWNRDHRDAGNLYPMMHSDRETYEVLINNQTTLEQMKPMLGRLDGVVGHQKSVDERVVRGLSPDSLKDLSECPFRYFSGKILNLPNDVYSDRDEGDLPSDIAGTLIHKILETFYQSIGDRPLRDVSTIEKNKLLKKSFEKGFSSLRETGLDVYPLVLEAQRQLIWRRIHSFVEKDWREMVQNNYKPEYFEAEIDGTIAQLSGHVSATKFHGRIDRIDIQNSPTGIQFRVVDYKTGKTSQKSSDTEKDILKGRYPQLPIYLGLTGPWLSKKLGKSVAAEGSHFYNLADWEAGRESPSLLPDFWKSNGRAYSEDLAAWINQAEKGIFFIRPSDERGYCRWCAFATLCRKEHKPTSWRSEHSRERSVMEDTIKKNGSTKNWIIEAGAGTGKTYHLVQGILRALFQKRLPLSSLVALTFTKKAAGEMKERVASELNVIVHAEALPEAYREWGLRLHDLKILAGHALDEIDRASISTIHSFAFMLLQRFPLASGINPGAEIDDKGLRSDEIFQTEWSRWLTVQLRLDSPHADEWISLLKQIPLSWIEDVARRLCDFDIPLEQLPLSDDGLEVSLEPHHEASRRLVSAHTKKVANTQIAAACEEVLGTAAHGAWEQLADISLDVRDALDLKVGTPKEWTDEEAVELKRLQKIAKNVLNRGDRLVAQITLRIKPFIARYRGVALAEGSLSHNALLALACRLIRTRHDVRVTLKREFRMIFIDEFQDTDPLQGELLLLLSEKIEGRADVWSDVHLEAGKLFVVGDPKQSIYHFRGADMAAYRRIIDLMTAQGARVMPLQQSRRSHDQIIHAVNAAFSVIIQEKGLIAPAYVPLEPLRVRQEDSIQDVELLLLRSATQLKADESREHEALDIARWIQDEKSAGRLDYKEVALIFRSTPAMHSFIEALRSKEIPFVVEGERYFYTMPEVTDLINFLRVVENPSDRLALVGFLRSPLGGFSDLDLLHLQEAGHLDGSLPLAPNAPPHQLKTWSLIKLLHARVGREPLKDILRHVFEDSFLMELAARSYHREQTLANVLKLKRLLESFAEEGVTTLRRLLARVQLFIREGELEGESPLADESYNAVRLLTIHKAKGLEFPIVILPNLQASRQNRPDPENVSVIHDWNSSRLGLRIQSHQNLASIELEAEADEREEEEEKRVLYVAMTRARERLIISGSVPATKDSYLTWLTAAWGVDLAEAASGAFSIGLSHITIRPIEVSDKSAPAIVPQIEPASNRISLDSFMKHWKEREDREHLALETPLVLTPSVLTENLKEAVGIPSDSNSESGELYDPDHARQVGTLVHQFLEQWNFAEAKCEMPEKLRDIANRSFASAGLLREKFSDPKKGWPAYAVTDPMAKLTRILKEAQDILAAFIGSAAYDEIKRSEILGREIPFFYRQTSSCPKFSSLMRGQIDLLYRMPDGMLVIADYKTDRPATEENLNRTAERYGKQAVAYQEAIERAYRVPAQVKLIYVRLGQSVSLSHVSVAQ